MKSTFVAALLLAAGILYANDTYIYSSVGGTLSGEYPDPSVRLGNELIRITLGQTTYTVDVAFVFNNSGPERTVKVGFPIFGVSDPSHRPTKQFQNFATFVAGKQVPFTLEQIPDFNPSGLRVRP